MKAGSYGHDLERHAGSSQVPVKLGPLALLLTVISICLTTLAILTWSTAQADRRLADRFADTVSVRCQLEKKGQEFLADLSEAVAENDTETLNRYQGADQNVYENRIEEGEAFLTVRVKRTGNDLSILSWRLSHSWEEDKEINIWNGSGLREEVK